MQDYCVEFEYWNKKGFVFSVKANNFEEAAVESIKKLTKKRIIIIGEYETGKIYNSKKRSYEILKNGEWLINTKTGKKLSDLEKKIN